MTSRHFVGREEEGRKEENPNSSLLSSHLKRTESMFLFHARFPCKTTSRSSFFSTSVVFHSLLAFASDILSSSVSFTFFILKFSCFISSSFDSFVPVKKLTALSSHVCHSKDSHEEPDDSLCDPSLSPVRRCYSIRVVRSIRIKFYVCVM